MRRREPALAGESHQRPHDLIPLVENEGEGDLTSVVMEPCRFHGPFDEHGRCQRALPVPRLRSLADRLPQRALWDMSRVLRILPIPRKVSWMRCPAPQAPRNPRGRRHHGGLRGPRRGMAAGARGRSATNDTAWLEGVWSGAEWESSASFFQGVHDLAVTFSADGMWAAIRQERSSLGRVRARG